MQTQSICDTSTGENKLWWPRCDCYDHDLLPLQRFKCTDNSFLFLHANVYEKEPSTAE